MFFLARPTNRLWDNGVSSLGIFGMTGSLRNDLILTVLMTVVLAASARADLLPSQVVIVANECSEESIWLAEYYARQRDIPQGNILLVNAPLGESIARDEYEYFIRKPIADAMQQQELAQARCIVLMRGMPLYIEPTELDPQRRQLARIYEQALRDGRIRLLDLAQQAQRVSGERLRRSTVPLSRDSTTHEIRATLNSALVRALAQEGMSPRVRSMYLQAQGLRGVMAYLQHHNPSEARGYQARLQAAQQALNENNRLPLSPRTISQRLSLLEETGGLSSAVFYAESQLRHFSPPADDASVDSELALVLAGRYKLDGPVSNPLRSAPGTNATPLLMTARIDGPGREDVTRMIKSSIKAEQEGLRGTFYIDSGGPSADFDNRLRKLHRLMLQMPGLRVHFDQSYDVLPPMSAPQAALYVGWYRPRQYVPSMMWVPGAVGWHIASDEARGISSPTSSSWCAGMIRNGAVATIGAVKDPTLGAFPIESEFFTLLLEGRYSLVECYWKSIPHASWRMTLIGDPLYRPFELNPIAAE